MKIARKRRTSLKKPVWFRFGRRFGNWFAGGSVAAIVGGAAGVSAFASVGMSFTMAGVAFLGVAGIGAWGAMRIRMSVPHNRRPICGSEV